MKLIPEIVHISDTETKHCDSEHRVASRMENGIFSYCSDKFIRRRKAGEKNEQITLIILRKLIYNWQEEEGESSGCLQAD
jgi:hypothetical protein